MKNTLFKFNILTIFPDLFPGYLGTSNAGRALEKGIWEINVVNIRDFAKDKHKTVDDVPYAGGAGMLIKPDVLGDAIESILVQNPNQKIIYFSPRGKVLNQSMVREFANINNDIDFKEITLICGHYEGIDQRVIDFYNIEEISIGDYVLSGGEMPAIIFMDSILRLLPGIIGKEESHQEESFDLGKGNLLEYPNYTRPAVWKGKKVPEILTNGHHAKIKEWQLKESEKITSKNRPDLYSKYQKSTKNS